MSTLAVRQAVLSDLSVLAPLFDDYRQFYGRPSDLQAVTAFLSARFNHGESVLFIAHEGIHPIGFAQLLYQSAGWKRDEQFLVYHFALPSP